jgi:signal transduction histidine kinase
MKFQISLIAVLLYLMVLPAGILSAQLSDFALLDENTELYSVIQESPQTNADQPDTTIVEEQGIDEDETEISRQEDSVITDSEVSVDLLSVLILFTASILFLSMLLHLVLYSTFDREISNSIAAMFSGLLFISYLGYYIGAYVAIPPEWNKWFEYVWMYGSIIGLHLLPFVLVTLTGMKDLKQSVHLVWFSILSFLISNYSPEFYFEYVLSAVIVFLAISGYFIYRASNQTRRNITALAAGFVIVVLASVLMVLQVYGILITSEVQMAGIVSVLYVALPISFVFFIMNLFGFQYSSFNQKIEKKSSEIEKARSQLKRLHDKLKETQEQLLEKDETDSDGMTLPLRVSEVRDKFRGISSISEQGLKYIRFTQNRLMEIRIADPHTDEQLNEIKTNLKKVESDLSQIKNQGNDIESQFKRINSGVGSGSQENGKIEINHLIRDTLQKTYDKFQARFNKHRIELDLALDKNAGVSNVDADDFRKVLKNIYHHAFESIREKIDHEKKRKGSGGQESYNFLNETPKLFIQTRREERRIFLKIEFDSLDNPEKKNVKTSNQSITESFSDQVSEPALIVASDLLKKHGLEMFILASGDETVIHLELKSADG